MRRSFILILICVPTVTLSACRTVERDPWRNPPGSGPYFAPPQPSATFPQMSPSVPAPVSPHTLQPPPGTQFQGQQQFPPGTFQPPPGSQIQNQQVEYRWRPPEIKLYAPQPAPDLNKESKTPKQSPEPPLLDSPPKAGLPVGIPQFASAGPNVATGLRSALDEGLDWLRSADYRTVLHVRAPGEDNATDRKEVEQRGMTYLELEVSPQTLSKDIVDSFNRTVADGSAMPLFVYDRDGSLAGALWYLHFRMSQQLSDDAARLRARGLGLREEDAAHRLMWLAVQRVLSELPR